MSAFQVHVLDPATDNWVAEFITQRWGSPQIVSRGRVYQANRLSGFAAFIASQPAGLITYHLHPDSCEVITLDIVQEGSGIGTALLDAVRQKAQELGCSRLWLVTTNDNLPALRFYQKRGFQLVSIHRRALDSYRRIKPQIPEIGLQGIPLRDEIELELPLDTR